MRDFEWMFHSGRTHEGEKFAAHCMLHGSGRILAKIAPAYEDSDTVCRLWFYCKVPKAALMESEEFYDFVDLDAAKRFAERIISRFDPMYEPAIPRKKQARKRVMVKA